jgi:competence CoiA-like predicted nuclease
MLWKKEANSLLTNLSTTEYQVSKWECVLWIDRTCFSRTECTFLDEHGFVFKSTHRLHSWTHDRNRQLFRIFWNIIVSSLSLNKTQCQLRTRNWSFIALIKSFHCHFDGITISTNFRSFRPIETRTSRRQRHLNLI